MADEEATGFRAANLLMSLGVRGMPVPEISHPQWGDYGRACESSGLTLPTLKLTLLCNFGRGPFRSGRFGYNVSKAAELFMSEVTDEFLESLTERIGLDQGLPPEEMVPITRDDWLSSHGIRTLRQLRRSQKLGSGSGKASLASTKCGLSWPTHATLRRRSWLA